MSVAIALIPSAKIQPGTLARLKKEAGLVKTILDLLAPSLLGLANL
jgi:hypothetical protein